MHKLDTILFRMRHLGVLSYLRCQYLRLLGATIGTGSKIGRVQTTWPHQLSIGANCLIEHGVKFKYDGPWRRGPSIVIGDNVFIGYETEFNIQGGVAVGSDSLIASGVRIIDHNHGMALGEIIRSQTYASEPITLGMDCWIGVNAVILAGVSIGDGAVIGAGAVVTRDVPAREIWGGVPARKIGVRCATPDRTDG